MLFSQTVPPSPLPSPNVCSLPLRLFCCLAYRAVIIIWGFLFEPWAIRSLRSWRKGFHRRFSSKGWSVLGPPAAGRAPRPHAHGQCSSLQPRGVCSKDSLTRSNIGCWKCKCSGHIFCSTVLFCWEIWGFRVPLFQIRVCRDGVSVPGLTWIRTSLSSANPKLLSSRDPTHSSFVSSVSSLKCPR